MNRVFQSTRWHMRKPSHFKFCPPTEVLKACEARPLATIQCNCWCRPVTSGLSFPRSKNQTWSSWAFLGVPYSAICRLESDRHCQWVGCYDLLLIVAHKVGLYTGFKHQQHSVDYTGTCALAMRNVMCRYKHTTQLVAVHTNRGRHSMSYHCCGSS